MRFVTLLILLFVSINVCISQSYSTNSIGMVFGWSVEKSSFKLDSINSPLSWYTKNFISDNWDTRTGNKGVRIIFNLTIDTTGKVKEIEFLSPSNSLCEAQIRNAFFKMPKWPVLKYTASSSTIKVKVDLTTMLSLDAKEVFYERGVENFEKNEFNKAIKNFNYSIDHNPYYTDAYYNRAAAYLKLQDTAKACIDWRIAAEMEDMECKQLFEKNCIKK